MKERVFVRDITDHVGSEIFVQGFVDTVRDQNKIAFVILRDFTGTVQCVLLKEIPDFDRARKISEESVVEIHGLVKEEKQAPGGVEIEVREFVVLSQAEPELPIPIHTKGDEGDVNITTRFDHRWLDLRKSPNATMIRAWNALEQGWRAYLKKNNYTQFYSPSLMNTPSESGAEVFKVAYFDRSAYLAQSPQFYKQMAIASGFERVFCAGPVFRAEESFTTRHMTEFTGWDFEIGYVTSHHDVMAEEEGMLVSAFSSLKEIVPELFEESRGEDRVVIPEQPFPRITMKEAKERLASTGIESKEKHDMSPEEERAINSIIREESGSDFVFITDYHQSVRPFYHMCHEDDPEVTKSADLLYKGLEITTLAQREHRPSILEKQAREKEMPLEGLEGYFDFFRYGCPPHGGGGIGANRLVMKVCGFDSVKEATFLPRDVNRLNP